MTRSRDAAGAGVLRATGGGSGARLSALGVSV